MGAEFIGMLVALGVAAAGWLDAKTKAIKAENATKKIETEREENKKKREDQINDLKNKINLLERDMKIVKELNLRNE